MRTLLLLPLILLAPSIATAQPPIDIADARFFYHAIRDSAIGRMGSDFCTVRSIVVTRRSDSAVVQTITPPENSAYCEISPIDVYPVVRLIDLDFDGYNDLQIVAHNTAGPNTPYINWLYSRRSGRFVRNEALDLITAPDVDPEKKEIVSTWRASCCHHGVSTYRWIGGRPTLVEEYSIESDPNDETAQIETLKRRVRGRMKQIYRRTAR